MPISFMRSADIVIFVLSPMLNSKHTQKNIANYNSVQNCTTAAPANKLNI